MEYLLKIYQEMGTLDIPIEKEWMQQIRESFETKAIYILELSNQTFMIDFSLVKMIEFGKKEKLSSN